MSPCSRKADAREKRREILARRDDRRGVIGARPPLRDDLASHPRRRGAASAPTPRAAQEGRDAARRRPSLPIPNRAPVCAIASRALARAVSSMEPLRSISPVKVPRASVSTPSARSTRKSNHCDRIGAMTRSLPCIVAIAARRPCRDGDAHVSPRQASGDVGFRRNVAPFARAEIAAQAPTLV